MSTDHKFTRRGFVKLAALGTLTISILPHCSGKAGSWRYFTDEEAILVDAVADQIIPPDEWPGGKDSGATNFIDKQLTGPYKRFRETYRKGLSAIRESCNILYQKRFEELAWDEQTLFLERMEAGEMQEEFWKDSFDEEFFTLIRDHCMQSFYGSPIHGGNRNKVSYLMLGVDYPFIIGQNRYKS